LQPDDLIKYGLIPEFVGRMPVIAALDLLTEKDLIRILVTPKNSVVKQYKKMFSMNNVDLEFTEGALEAIAKKAIKLKTGARGLRSIVEESMLDLMYEIPSDKSIIKVVIDKEFVNKKAYPARILRNSKEKKEA
jgi:ATP-dependent Clp protease ATP-binding subunit ClpX